MREVKSSGAAVVLSFFWTGLGQLYAGKVGRGLAMMALTPVVWSISFMSGCMGLLWSGAGASSALLRAAHEPGAGTAGQSAFFGGLGAGALLLSLIPIAWWIWGMLDAKKQCELHNAEGSANLA